MVKSVYLWACIVLLSLSSTAAIAAESDGRSYALFGEIVSVNVGASHLRIKLSNDSEQDVVVNADSVLIREARTANLADFQLGDQVIVTGTRNAAGQIAARRVMGGDLQKYLSGGAHAGLKEILAEIARRFELTNAQIEQIRSILETERPRVQPLILQLVLAEATLRGMTQNGRFNEVQVRLVANQQGQILAKLIVEKERVISQIYSVLTPEQQAKVNQVQAELLDVLLKKVMQPAKGGGNVWLRF